MLEIMLSKLHVTSLAIKEQIKRGKKKKNSLGLHLVHFFFKTTAESRGLFLRSGNLGCARRKAKREKKKSTRGVKCEGK